MRCFFESVEICAHLQLSSNFYVAAQSGVRLSFVIEVAGRFAALSQTQLSRDVCACSSHSCRISCHGYSVENIIPLSRLRCRFFF